MSGWHFRYLNGDLWYRSHSNDITIRLPTCFEGKIGTGMTGMSCLLWTQITLSMLLNQTSEEGTTDSFASRCLLLVSGKSDIRQVRPPLFDSVLRLR